MRLARRFLFCCLLWPVVANAQQIAAPREQVIGELSPKGLLYNQRRSPYFTQMSEKAALEYRAIGFATDAAGRRLAWADVEKNRAAVVLDGVRGPEFKHVGPPAMSPDGSRLAYAARPASAEKWSLVVDGKLQEPGYDDIAQLQFSPDGKRLAYAVRQGRTWRVLLDGEPVGEEYNTVGALNFSPDSRRFAFYAEGRFQFAKGTTWTVVVDGQPIAPPAERRFCQIGGFSFTADSQRYAFAASSVGGGWRGRMAGHVVVNGQHGLEYEGAGPSPQIPCGYEYPLSPDGAGVSFPVWKPGAAVLAYAARRGKKEVAVFVDNQPGPAFEAVIAGPVFSSDGHHLAYVAWDNKRIIEMVDGKPVRDFPSEAGANFVRHLTFSRDGNRLAYVIGRGGYLFTIGNVARARRRVVANGREGRVFDVIAVSDLQFSPEGRHLGYVIHGLDENRSAVIIDDVQSELLDVIPGTLRFTDEKTVTYFARRDRTILRVTQALP